MRYPITVVYFNALHGFHSTTPPYLLESKRLAAAQRVMDSLSPSILGITEACYDAANPYGQRLDYSKIFSMPSVRVTPWGDHEWANALLTKHTITAHETIPFGARTASRSYIRIDDRLTLTLDLCHTDPIDNDNVRQAAMHNLLRSRPTKNYVLMGDLNASWEYRSGLLKQLREQGLTDVMSGSSDHTAPTPAYRHQQRQPSRVDYIWCSPDLMILRAGTIRTKDAEVASDHYPVYAVLEVTSADHAGKSAR